MERKIKFRGKSLNTGEWFYGNLFVGDINGRTHISTTKRGCLNIDPETVGQFTGLFDKAGKEIYEGDIITSDEIHKRVIEWNSSECKFNAVEWGVNQAIILGNIHDNPELLKSNEHE